METITKFFKEENDFLYRKGEAKGEIRGEIRGEERGEERGEARGEEKGREEERVKVVINLISQLGLSDEQIAPIAEVSVDFVKSVRAGLKR